MRQLRTVATQRRLLQNRGYQCSTGILHAASAGNGHGKAGVPPSCMASASVGAAASSSSASSSSPPSSSSATSSASGGASCRQASFLYHCFMGSSTRFRLQNPSLTRAGIQQLEKEPLSHSAPGRVNDHVCIAMVKLLRWCSDRVFRERFIHRATMLVTVAAAAPAAGAVAAYLRMFSKKKSTRVGDNAADMGSPYIAAIPPSPTTRHGTSSTISTGHGSPHRPSVSDRPSVATHDTAAAACRHFYVDELRGLMAQAESHAVHYQILWNMAEVSPLERGAVLVMQALHFSIYFLLFLLYPRMGFRLLAYTAEESAVVWTQMVNDIDLGKIAAYHVPQLALEYWGLHRYVAQGAPVPMVVAPVARGAALATTEYSAAIPQSAGAAMESPELATPARTSGSSLSHDARGRGTLPSSATPSAARSRDSPEDYTISLRDVVLLIRSDEMVFRELNHQFADELDRQPGWMASFMRYVSGNRE